MKSEHDWGVLFETSDLSQVLDNPGEWPAGLNRLPVRRVDVLNPERLLFGWIDPDEPTTVALGWINPDWPHLSETPGAPEKREAYVSVGVVMAAGWRLDMDRIREADIGEAEP